MKNLNWHILISGRELGSKKAMLTPTKNNQIDEQGVKDLLVYLEESGYTAELVIAKDQLS